MTEFFSAQLKREAVGTRRALERVPEGRPDWKPHEKSMPLGLPVAARRDDALVDRHADHAG
jgi:hypothetical protein